jgi:hypothetical protein
MKEGVKVLAIALWVLMLVLAIPTSIVNPLGIFANFGLLALVALTTAVMSVVPGGAKDSKIDNFWTATLLALALFFDLVQAILSLLDTGVLSGNIVAAVQLTVFTFLFKALGTSYWGGREKLVKNLTSKVTTMVLEFVPVLAPFLPSTYIMMVFAIFFVRAEEKGGLMGALAGKAGAEAKGKIKKQARPNPTRPQGANGARILNNQRTPEERRARFQQQQAPNRDEQSTPRGGERPANVLDLKGKEAAKAA